MLTCLFLTQVFESQLRDGAPQLDSTGQPALRVQARLGVTSLSAEVARRSWCVVSVLSDGNTLDASSCRPHQLYRRGKLSIVIIIIIIIITIIITFINHCYFTNISFLSEYAAQQSTTQDIATRPGCTRQALYIAHRSAATSSRFVSRRTARLVVARQRRLTRSVGAGRRHTPQHYVHASHR